jgi:ELWxxDGT repeat protein
VNTGTSNNVSVLGTPSTPGNVGLELFKYSPATQTVSLVADIDPGGFDLGTTPPSYANSSNAARFYAFQGKMYFTASDGVNGSEMWAYNPATGTASLFKDFNPGPLDGSPDHYTEVGGKLVMAAHDSSYPAGGFTAIGNNEFWYYDPTPNTFTKFELSTSTANPNFGSSPLEDRAVIGTKVYFGASNVYLPNFNEALWVWDAAAPGTAPARVGPEINPGSGADGFTDFTVLGGKLYFRANDGDAAVGDELWRFDPVNSSIVNVFDINPGTADSFPGGLTVLGGKLYFSAESDSQGRELWVHDPAAGTTTRLTDLNPGTADTSPGGFTAFGGKLYFGANGGATVGRELYVLDPATNAVTLVQDINPGAGNGSPGEFTEAGGNLYFRANGGATIGTELYVLAGAAANTAPTITPIADRTINEDGSTGAIAFTIGDAQTAAGSLTVTATSSNTTLIPSANVVLGGSGAGRTVTVTPAANRNGGPVTITVTVGDGSLSTSETFTVTVNPVNDEPSFTTLGNRSVNEDAGTQSVPGFATASRGGGTDEIGQTFTYNVSNNNPNLFSGQPAIAPNGTLTFTPSPNASGTATVTVSVTDSGGTANGGVNTSGSQTFTIAVTPVNDAPGFSAGPNVAVLEDSGSYAAAWASAISAGPANESGQSVGFLVSNDGNALFSVQPAIAPGGTLTFTPAPNANGSATVTVRVRDDGGTGNGGIDTSAIQMFIITITSVNDAPVGTGATVTTPEDTAYPIAAADFGFTDPSDSPAGGFLAVTIVSLPAAGVLRLDGVAVAAGQSIAATDLAAGKLTFVPAADANGAGYAGFTFRVQDDGGTANGGSDLDPTPRTMTIDVTAVNDAPVNTVPGAQTAAEDAPLALVGLAIADVDAGAGAVRVTLAVGNGTLTVRTDVPGGLSGANLGGNGTGTVVLTGTADQINATLGAANGLVYLGNQDYSGPDLLTVTTNDLGNTGLGGALTDTDTVALSVLSASQQAGKLADLVGALVTAGTLNAGQGNALTTKLKNVTNTGGANQVRAFINQLTDLVRTGVLTQAEADPLLTAARLVLVSLA